MKVSLYAGFALGCRDPLAGLGLSRARVEEGHRRALLGFVSFASVLFAVGVGFGYVVALPAAVHFLTSYDSQVFNIQVHASSYYSFALLSLLAVGLVFELPIFVLALVRLGITSAAKLRRNRRIGYVAMAAVAVAMPGVDPVTTAFEMVPLMLLFESSIWLSVAFERRCARVRCSTCNHRRT